MIEVYKIMHGLVRTDKEIFFETQSSSTRGHCLRIKKKFSRLDVRKFSFSNRVVNDWNSLPEGVVLATTIDIFKRKLDIYISEKLYIRPPRQTKPTKASPIADIL